jgi:RimJ/RimL family protein N-acetyltransferase
MALPEQRFDSNKTLIFTRRLILRRPEPGDIPGVTRMVNDRTIARWVSGIRYPYSAMEGRKYVNSSARQRGTTGAPGNLLILLRSNPRLVIGSINLSRRGSAYILGYWMGRAYRGRGFVNEAARTLIAMAFNGGAQAVTASFQEGNDASRRVMERLGMRRSGMTYGYSRFLKRKSRLIIYRITAAEWLKRTDKSRSSCHPR